MVAAFTLVDTAGTSHALGSSTGVYLLRGAKGLGGPTITVNRQGEPRA